MSNSLSFPSIPFTPKLTVDVQYHNINGLGDKLGESDVLDGILQRDITIYAEAMKGPSFQHIIDGYSVQNFPHSKHKKCKRRVPGGFVLIVKNSIRKHVKVVKQNDHVIWLRLTNLIESNVNTFFLCAVYIPHERSTLRDTDKDEIESIQNDIEYYSNMGIIYPMGDWNSRTGNLRDFIDTKNAIHQVPLVIDQFSHGSRRQNVDMTVNSHGKKLINLCKTTGYQIQNGRINEKSNVFTCYRHNGQSAVDYLLARNDSAYLIQDFEVQPHTVNSDHSALTFSLPAKQITLHSPASKSRPVQREIKRYKFEKSRENQYHIELSKADNKNRHEDFLCDIVSKDLTHKEVIDNFYDCIMPPIKDTFRVVQNKKKTNFPKNDWFDQECKELKRKANDLLKLDPHSIEANDIKKEYHRIRQTKKRLRRKKVSTNAHNLKVDKPQEFWNYFVMKKENCDQDIEVGNFTDFYKNVASNHLTANDENYNHEIMKKIETLISEVDMDREIATYIDSPVFDSLNGPISDKEIENAFKRTKNKKAAGCDGLVSEFFKYSNGHLEGPLTALFNFIMNSGEYPDQWSDGIINPIHKKKSKADPGNYRKITVLPALGKLFDTILNSRLTTMKNLMQCYDRFQFGFKEKHGAVDNAFILDSIIEINKARGRPTYVCYIDLKSAFDMILRAALLWKMRKQGIKGKFFAIISSMFKKAKSSVKWAGQLGETFENICGVLQGGVTSPQLFKIFLEDLVKYLDKSCGIHIDKDTICHLLLADDLALLSETRSGLQRLLNGFSNFCQQWHLVVNMDKTKVSVFNKHLAIGSRNDPIYYNKEVVEETNDYVYVGINFSTAKNRFQTHLENVADSANRAIFGAMSLARNACGGELSALTHLHIFDTQVRPILEYASPIWFTNKSLDILEIIQTKFLKRSLGVGNSTPTLAVYGDTCRYPLLLRQRYSFLKYWARISQMPEGSVLHSIYKEHLNLETSYIKKVKLTLEAAGVVSENIPHITKHDTAFFLKHMRHNLEFLYKTSWLTDINDSVKNPMLRFYKIFKKTFESEPYIKMISDRKIQKSLSKFRLSSHCLRIHKGRHERDKNNKNTPANKRFCLSCKSGEIDDELHLFGKCTTHNLERKNFLTKINSYVPTSNPSTPVEIISLILNSNNKKVIFELGKFLKTAFSKRKLETQIV